VTINRRRRDEVAFAVRRLDLLGFEIAATAVFLDGADRSRVPGGGVPVGCSSTERR
jgi:hypothetical protein